jgi:hypothetical protein
MGRKKIDIDFDKVKAYLQAGCNGASIARIMGFDPETLYRAVRRLYKMDFSKFAQIKKEEGVSLMVASIYQDAMLHGGADRMFWLKNNAGWSDKQDITSKGQQIQPINIVVDSKETGDVLNKLIKDPQPQQQPSNLISSN